MLVPSSPGGEHWSLNSGPCQIRISGKIWTLSNQKFEHFPNFYPKKWRK